MLNALLEQVKNAIFNDPTTPHQPGHDPSGLIDQISGLFGQFGNQQNGQPGMGNVRPASEDPMGDPADQGYGNASYGNQGFGNVRPASEDPMGDPANQGYGNVRPASEDPLGDPADDPRYR